MRATDGQPDADTAARVHEKPLGGDWATMLWDDPITLQPYVVRVLMRRFGYSRARAHELMALAERDGHLIAFAEVVLGARHPLVPQDAVAELTRLYVQSPFLRRGIGRRLLRHAEALASTEGASTLWLTAWVGNARALSFYASQGYDVLCLSDHFTERFGFPVADTRAFRREDFTTIFGAELHAPANSQGEVWHILACGLPLDFAPNRPGEDGVALARRARAVGGQRQQHGGVGEVFAPPGGLGLQGGAIEGAVLPAGIVGILDRQRGQRIFLAQRKSPVQGGQFGAQDADRPAVGDDMVHGDEQHVLIWGER